MRGSFEIINKGGAVYFYCTEITAPHGFFTRLGGVSQISHLASMNLGKNLDDKPEYVEENYKIISKTLGFTSENYVYTNQVHSNIVKIVGKYDIGKTINCDSLVTNSKHVTIGVRTADCVPILFYSKDICIGAAHAGWRGTVYGIQQKTVDKMQKLGANISDIKVAIGPAIHDCCYEVGKDFYNTVSNIRGAEFSNRNIKINESGKYYADLISMNKELLYERGIQEKNIIISPYCTACNPNLFFSHRASKGKRGVMGSFITLE